ncbi:hypothetical protein DdX_18682 [Ditylenchus destructor]|uniref:F-box domain-containing protein n=1 Tax=Ditylenchus destructor TaxID=166010 RepID=A0AAD4MP31_9BILA|nr:hypothetical protein DdX_18682 [Ditylenchus destructor]
MSSLPNEIFSDITNFLPNDDITDLMLMSRTFNTLVTPRLQKIHEWISQLNLKRFEPIGSAAKKRMKDMFENEEEFRNHLSSATIGCDIGMLDEILDGLKERMSLERFDNLTFLCILSALVSVPKFREEYNISKSTGLICVHMASYEYNRNFETCEDMLRIWKFYNPNSCDDY